MFALLLILMASASAFIFGLATTVPQGFVVELPHFGLLRQRRASLEKRSRAYPILLGVIRVFVYHGRPIFHHRLCIGFMQWMEPRLMRAGYPGGLSVEEYIGLMGLAHVGGAAAAMLLSWFVTGRPDPFAMLAASLLLSGLPVLWIDDIERQRLRAITQALPYVLDLLTLSLGAGLDFVQALHSVAKDRPEGDVMGEELGIVLHEIALGKTRREALIGLKARVNLVYLADLVAGLVQAEQMGTPLVRTLRVQSSSVRLRRTQRAEKLAGEAPVKLLLPMMFLLGSVILTIFGSFIVRAANGSLL